MTSLQLDEFPCSALNRVNKCQLDSLSKLSKAESTFLPSSPCMTSMKKVKLTRNKELSLVEIAHAYVLLRPVVVLEYQQIISQLFGCHVHSNSVNPWNGVVIRHGNHCGCINPLPSSFWSINDLSIEVYRHLSLIHI